MICGRKETLLRFCNLYVKEYADATMKLGGISGKIARDDWQLAWDLAERAKKKSVEMFSQLQRHKQEHGC